MFNPKLLYEFGKGQKTFVSTWKTDNTSTGSSGINQVKLPLISSGIYNMVVDWGDGTNSKITAYNQAEVTHTYSLVGTYTIKITGKCIGWTFNNIGDRLKIISIQRWGILQITSSGAHFLGCSNLTLNSVSDIIDLSACNNLQDSFRNCSNLTTINNSNKWDTSNITNMGAMFSGATLLNTPLNEWNVSKVTTFGQMFQNCSYFNQPLYNWNVSSCSNFTQMFRFASSFNQNIGGWKLRTTTSISMYGMFQQATSFNNGDSDSINNWNTSKVSTFEYCFAGTAFNQPIGKWNLESCTNCASMFNGATKFNQNINSWNTSNVINMNSMFCGTTAFNQPLNNWDTSKVTDMSFMFKYAVVFNQNLNNWDVSKVTNMNSMFVLASSFNNGLTAGVEGILSWTTPQLNSMNQTFSNAIAFNCDLGSWNTSLVTTFFNLFYGATKFNNGGNANINNWNTGNVIAMNGVFGGCNSFNQPIGNWNTTKVNNTSLMFYYASLFNQDISNWDVSNVIDMSSMFNNSNFNQNIGSWNISKVTNFNNFMTIKTPLTFSSSNLDAIYIGWSSRPVKPNVIINFGTAKSSLNSTTGKAILTGSPNNWTIIDGGLL